MNKLIRDIVVMGGGFRTPYSVDFSLFGALPNNWVGFGAAITDGKLVITPTIGATEKLTNGNLETWASDTDAGTWTELKSGTSTVNKDASVFHGGEFAARLDIDASNSYAYLTQTVAAAVGDWARISYWLKSSAAGKTGIALLGDSGIVRNPGTTFTNYIDTIRASTLNPTLTVGRSNATSGSLYIDDVSVRLLTLSSLFSYVNKPANNVNEVKAGWNISAGNPAGVFGWWNGVTINQNCIMAYCDGAKARLVKFVGATRTELIAPTAITYVAGASVSIKRSVGTNTFQLFYNAQQVGTDQTIADVEIIDNKYFGLFSTSESNQCTNFKLLDGAPVQFSFIGDSITTGQYPFGIVNGYKKIALANKNHAVSGHSIMANMDAQVTASASDAANIIIIGLGTNDNAAGDMAALQAEVEENLAELKASNTSATLYYMNVLPRWTDVGGGTVVDHTNTRAAIAAACLAQGVTCWDTFTDPWITVSDTSDGTHPNDAGHIKIATQILQRL